MRRVLSAAVCVALAAPVASAAAQNPFQLPKPKTKALAVHYQYAGDMTGTGQVAVSGERRMSRMTTTGKFFGKTSTTDTWSLFTPDSMYTADLVKKKGTRSPNVLPYMAKAYDDLDGASKTRLKQNMQDMVQMITRAFGTQTLAAGEKLGTKTYAGEKCDELSYGAFSYCGMQSSPGVPLHVQASFLCVDYEQTATAVKKGEPGAGPFAEPAGVVFEEDPHMQHPDSLARGFVTYLASQQLADSIAKAKAEMANDAKADPKADSKAPGRGNTGEKPKELTPEEKEQQRKTCEALKNFNLGKTMGNAAKQVVSEAVHEAVQERKAEARQDAKNKIKGLIKKPKF